MYSMQQNANMSAANGATVSPPASVYGGSANASPAPSVHGGNNMPTEQQQRRTHPCGTPSDRKTASNVWNHSAGMYVPISAPWDAKY